MLLSDLLRLPHAAATLIVASIFLTVSGGALAQSNTAAVPDKAAGERIAREGVPPKVAACISCHGANGEGAAAFPPLAATGTAYLQAQLEAFASGARANAIMEPIAKALEPAQRVNVSAWFASLPSALAASQTERPAVPKDAGAWLAQRGNWEHGVPACAQCHGPGGMGVPPHFPPIGGLTSAYMQEQITAWKSGVRPPGPLGLMETVAKQLDDKDVAAVAAYYAQLHTPSTAPEASASTAASTSAGSANSRGGNATKEKP